MQQSALPARLKSERAAVELFDGVGPESGVQSTVSRNLRVPLPLVVRIHGRRCAVFAVTSHFSFKMSNLNNSHQIHASKVLYVCMYVDSG